MDIILDKLNECQQKGSMSSITRLSGIFNGEQMETNSMGKSPSYAETSEKDDTIDHKMLNVTTLKSLSKIPRKSVLKKKHTLSKTDKNRDNLVRRNKNSRRRTCQNG